MEASFLCQDAPTLGTEERFLRPGGRILRKDALILRPGARFLREDALILLWGAYFLRQGGSFLKRGRKTLNCPARFVNEGLSFLIAFTSAEFECAYLLILGAVCSEQGLYILLNVQCYIYQASDFSIKGFVPCYASIA